MLKLRLFNHSLLCLVALCVASSAFFHSAHSASKEKNKSAPIPVVNVADKMPANTKANGIAVSAHIQKALDSGRDLYFPPGIYFSARPLVLRHDNQRIYGEGEILVSDWVGFVAESNVENIRIEGLTIRNVGKKEGGRDDAVGIFSQPKNAGFERSVFSNLRIIGFGMGINISGASDASLYSPFSQERFEKAGGIAGSQGRNIISGCQILDTLSKERIGSGGGHGIYVRGGYFQIYGNRIENMQGGILSPTFGVVANNIILNAWNDNGIYASGSKFLTISGNYIENTHADGVAVNGGSNVVVSGNILVNPGNGCFRVQAASAVSITGNNCRATPHTGHFVRGFASKDFDGSRNIMIVHNTFRGKTRGNPIVFTAGKSKHENIKIHDNFFIDVDTSELNISFFGPYAVVNVMRSSEGDKPSHVSVRDNTFENIRKVSKSFRKLLMGATKRSNNIFVAKRD